MKKLAKKLELLKKIMENSSKLFSNLRRKNVITENENNYFRSNF